MVERTLAILKPDCVRKNLIGEVIARIQKDGFKIVALKKVRLTKETAGGFYAVHKGRPFKMGWWNLCVPVPLFRLRWKKKMRLPISVR